MSMKKMLAVVAAAALVAISAPAFAANPFMDVPMNHWAYDAVEKLAAAGVIEGYPDGSFKGQKPITRYEMSMMVARAMASGGLGGEDGALLKRLIVEFKDELDALGVKVDGMDARLTDLEKGVGGWKLWGELRLDAKWFDNQDEGFELNRYRIWMSKKVDDNTTFTARIGAGNSGAMKFDRYYFDFNDFLFGSTLTAGKFQYDWEDDDGLYTDNDAFIGDSVVTGFRLAKDFSAGQFAVVASSEDGVTSDSNYVYAARFKFNPGEHFWLSLNAKFDNAIDVNTYWAGLGYKFNENFELKGAFYFQDKDAGVEGNAWKAILDVKQEALKFTSLWIEYARFEEGFRADHDPYAFGGDWEVLPALRSGDFNKTAAGAELDIDVLFVKAEQKWNDQWSTFGRFMKAWDANGKDNDARNWTAGVKYQYTPALSFELAYDDIDIDYGTDDHLIRFRTHLKF